MEVDVESVKSSFDGGDQEDMELAEEGLEMIKRIEGEGRFGGVQKLGYNIEDYHMESYDLEGCVHEYVAPKGIMRRTDFIRPKVKPKQYKFTLDKFQDRAVECIERNESVLVAAHTSAGKTAIAEYAIASSLKNKQRVIYTSPIKALSNQKYRELQEEF